MRCKGKTRKGERCRRTIPEGKEYCFLHSAKGIRTEIKAAIMGMIGLILLAVIPIIYDAISQKPQLPKLELIDVSPYLCSPAYPDFCLVDIKLKNSGDAVSYIKRLRIDVLESYKFQYKSGRIPMASRPPTAIYHISLGHLGKGESDQFNISHIIGGGETDRIILTFGGPKMPDFANACLTRITLTIIADHRTQLTSKPIDVLVLKCDEGIQLPLDQLGDGAKIMERLMRAKALRVLTQDYIQRFLRAESISIPSWFR